jgi:hypothetical protein
VSFCLTISTVYYTRGNTTLTVPPTPVTFPLWPWSLCLPVFPPVSVSPCCLCLRCPPPPEDDVRLGLGVGMLHNYCCKTRHFPFFSLSFPFLLFSLLIQIQIYSSVSTGLKYCIVCSVRSFRFVSIFSIPVLTLNI